MKQNLVVFLADMYNALELNSAECVRYPGKERAHQFLDGKYSFFSKKKKIK